MSMAEWDRTPWYEQRILREGLHAEQPWIQRAAMVSRVEDPLSLGAGVFSDQLDGPDGDEADLSTVGITVRQSSVVTPLYRPARG